jgi:hypothetical protein
LSQPSFHPKPSTRFLQRFTLPSDAHPFIGRIYDLSIAEMNFASYDRPASFPDCKYVRDVNVAVSMLVRRVESLNMVESLLWPEPVAG